MSQVFEGYERQYCELCANLSKTITSASLLDDEQKKQKVSDINGGLEDAEALIRKMDVEATSLSPSGKATLLAKLREYKTHLNNLKMEVKRITSTNSNQAPQDDLLESGTADTMMASADQRGRLMVSTDRLNKSSDRISDKKPAGNNPVKVQLVDLERAYNVEIMLRKVKMPLPNMMAAALAMDDSILDADQVEDLIKFCPKKEEMELLKGYTGDPENLGKCEQFFLELMKAPRMESRLRVFLFKIQFNSQVLDFRKALTVVNSACEEVQNSLKLKEIMKKILYLGSALNEGTARGAAIGFKLDSLIKLADTRGIAQKMTLMNYLCKAIASKNPDLLDFHKDFTHLEAASKIKLKALAEERQAIIKGIEKAKQEMAASEHDGPVSAGFHKTLKEFVIAADSELTDVTNLYSIAEKNADALALYFGEDPTKCSLEQVTGTFLNFVRLFQKAHEDNLKHAELDKKRAQKVLMQKALQS